MSRRELRFDSESLKIFNQEKSLWRKIKPWLFSFFLGLFLAVIFVIFFNDYLGTPKEKVLEEQLDAYKFRYRILNDKIDLMQEVLSELQDRDDNIYRMIFESEPIPSSVRDGGVGGIDRYGHLDDIDNTSIIKNTYKKLDAVATKMVVQSISFDEIYKLAKNKEAMVASIPAIQPVANTDLRRIASYFGYRTDPFYKITKFHEGIDFTGAVGTLIYATGNGKVVYAKYNSGGYGNMVKIDHGFGYTTVYAHLHKINVRVGQQVNRGEIIGTMGNTGKSTGPHLHYEVRKGNAAVNPIYFFFNDISPEQYQQMVELSKVPSQTMD
ncbi:MAG: M23 family metallopeptidase [Bacteroidales bacterium]|jgi:murein DD-endopeptidase MepM/ murein hydrolase activator NlpD